MAIDPSAEFPGQIDLSDPTGYPYGKAKNILVTGDGTGTPWEQRVANDLFGFQQALLDEVSATPSGTPDKVGASQYLDAIKTLLAPKAIAPVTSADNSIPRMDGTDAKTLQSSGVQISDANEIVYATPPTRRVVVALPTLLDGWERNGFDSVWATGGASSVCVFDLSFLPDGATLNTVSFLIVPASAATMTVGVNARTRNFGTPAAGSSSSLASDVSSGSSIQVVALASLAASVDKSNGKSLVAHVTAGTTNDFCFGIAVDFTDPGPRNF